MCCALFPQSITLRHTYVTGPVPVDLYECTNLTTIDLAYNHLTVRLIVIVASLILLRRGGRAGQSAICITNP